MNMIGWLILLGSLFGLLAPLAFEDPPEDGISVAALHIFPTIMFFTALAPHPARTFLSRATALFYSANLVQGSPTGPRQPQLPRATTEVDFISTCTQQGYAQAIAEAVLRYERLQMCAPSAIEDSRHRLEDENEKWQSALKDIEAEYAGEGQQRHAEHTWTTVNDQVAYRSAILVCGAYHFRRWKYVTDLSADYNELTRSNASLSRQVADLTSSLQISYDYSRALGKHYAKLLEENDKLRKSNLRMLVLHKRALDTNGTGSTNASINATTASTNQTIGERIATLEAKSKSSTDPQWKMISTEVFLVVGWIGSANGFLVMLLDNWWPRLIWFVASFLSLFNYCWNTKPFQDRITKKWPTKSTLASEVKSHVADHIALKTAFDSLDKAFNVLIAADPSGWGPNGRLSTLEEKHDALQARYDTLEGEFVSLVRGVPQVRRALRACEAHIAQGGDFRRLRASVMQLDRKFLVFGGRSGRVTALEAEVAYLTERLEALENASLS